MWLRFCETHGGGADVSEQARAVFLAFAPSNPEFGEPSL